MIEMTLLACALDCVAVTTLRTPRLAPGPSVMVKQQTVITHRVRIEPEDKPSFLFRLETWLVLASVSLFFQLFPATFWGLLWAIDARNWTWGVWVGVEIGVIVTLVGIKAWHNANA